MLFVSFDLVRFLFITIPGCILSRISKPSILGRKIRNLRRSSEAPEILTYFYTLIITQTKTHCKCQFSVNFRSSQLARVRVEYQLDGFDCELQVYILQSRTAIPQLSHEIVTINSVRKMVCQPQHM